MANWFKKHSLITNLIGMVLVVFVIAALFFLSLGFLTKHGDYIKVPDVLNQPSAQADQMLTKGGFKSVVEDSAYIDSLPALIVLKQKPLGGNQVKVGRTVYLTLNKKVPPATAMPDLVNYSFRSAKMTLATQGLKLGNVSYKPDIAKDAVLEQHYKGKKIKPGEELPEGSEISLVLGDGLTDASNPVPDLIGLTYSEATTLIIASGLNLGTVITEGEIRDTADAHVVKQLPEAKDENGNENEIKMGVSMDIWISNDSSPF